jgi:hypothetical protein
LGDTQPGASKIAVVELTPPSAKGEVSTRTGETAALIEIHKLADHPDAVGSVLLDHD